MKDSKQRIQSQQDSLLARYDQDIAACQDKQKETDGIIILSWHFRGIYTSVSPKGGKGAPQRGEGSAAPSNLPCSHSTGFSSIR